MDGNEVQVAECKSVTNYGEPVSAIERMISAGVKPEDLEKFLAIQERYEENEAKKAYVKAMAEFKKNPPEIDKDRVVDFTSQKGRTNYRHASLNNVTTKITKGLAQHGISPSWKTEQEENGNIKITCTVTHELGHSESTSLTAAPDTSGNKNSIQAIGSTISYLERYTILALTGLSTRDMDDDGNAAGEPLEFITKEQVKEISALVAKKKGGWESFKKWMDSWCPIESVDEIPAKAYEQVMDALK